MTKTAALMLVATVLGVDGFAPQVPARPTTTLFMGKGMNKFRSKQADLKRKMELAKQQNRGEGDEEVVDEGKPQRLSDKEMKERNDRLRFEELLKKGSAASMSDFSSDGYLNQKQEDENIDAMRAGVDRLFEGDPAPTECFEELLNIKSENAIGSRGAERLVPWLRKNPARQSDYTVILCDPRRQSSELREACQKCQSELPVDIRSRLIIINADSPAENRRWLKKDELVDKVEVYSDEKMDWMRAYTALGEKRWSMTMFVISDERVQKVAREVDIYSVSKSVKNAVKSMRDSKL